MEESIPRPTLEWHITDVCNYACEYCCEKRYDKKRPSMGIASDETIEKALEEIKRLPGKWLIRFASGEPTLHPRLFYLCGEVAKTQHSLALITNFHWSKEKLQQFSDICGEKLELFTPSLHLSQTNVENFIDKAIWFNSIKNPRTRFVVSSVVTEENFERLKGIEERFSTAGVAFSLQVLRKNGISVKYPRHIEEYLAPRLEKFRKKFRNLSFLGRKCYSGDLFFVIKPNGDVFRCLEPQPFSYLGNITKGTFKRNNGATACLSPVCMCPTAARHNMILEEKESFLKVGYLIGKGLIEDKSLRKKAVKFSIESVKAKFSLDKKA